MHDATSHPHAPASVRPPALASTLLGWLAGSALQLQQPELASATSYGFFGFISLSIWSLFAIKKVYWRAPAWLHGLAMALAAGALAFALTGTRALVFQADALAPALEGRDLAVQGVVSAMPQRSEAGLRFRFAVAQATLDGQPVRVPPQVYLNWYGGVVADATAPTDALADALAGAAAPRFGLQALPPELRAGDRWQFTVRLKAPHGTANPHGFDLELWMWEQGLQANGYVRAGPRDPVPQRLASSWRHPFERARQAVRDAVLQRLARQTPADPADAAARARAAGVVAALATGDQAAIDRADWDVFRATGVAHLMSISGLHITLFAWLATLAVGGAWRRSVRLCNAMPAPHAALLGGVLLAGAYAVFSGWGVPAQRTVWMLATVALLRWSGRQWPWPMVWLLTCAVVVAADPWALLQAGFWLSFVAVGVLFASAEDTTEKEANNGLLAGAKAKFFHALREQWVVTLALTPLSLLLFGQASLVGLVANALAIPWVTLVVTPLALLGALWAPLWDAATGAVQWLGALLQVLAALPWATWAMATPPLWAGVAGVAGGLLLALRLPLALRLQGVALVLPALLWQVPTPTPGRFELLAADIGQGNAVIVRTHGYALLYDTGPRYSAESDAGHRILVPLLRALNVRLDTVLVSHRDSDHSGGAAAVLAMQPQAQLLSSLEDAHTLLASQPAARTTRCQAGQHWVWDGVRFDVLHPLPAAYTAPARPNAMSCVLRVSDGQRTALLVGDIEQPQEARLLADAAPLKTDLLLVPHHGSKTSSSAAFLDAAQPTLALVQAGYRNRFGHPAAPVRERYDARGIRVIDSARCGAATWRSGQPDVLRCERVEGLRYWRHRVP